jgi:hypothetical protein
METRSSLGFEWATVVVHDPPPRNQIRRVRNHACRRCTSELHRGYAIVDAAMLKEGAANSPRKVAPFRPWGLC